MGFQGAWRRTRRGNGHVVARLCLAARRGLGLNSRFLPSLTRLSAVPVVTILEVYAYSGDYDP